VTELTVRLIAPNDETQVGLASGRKINRHADGYFDIPVSSASSLVNAGWQFASGCGTTSQRPALNFVGQMFFDRTISKPVWYDGAGWVGADGEAA